MPNGRGLLKQLASAAALACLAAAVPGAARAQSITAALSSPAYVNPGQPTVLNVTFTYNKAKRVPPALHELDLWFPSNVTVNAIGDLAGWTHQSLPYNGGTWVEWDAPCANAGLAAGSSITVQVTVTVGSQPNDGDLSVTAYGSSPYYPKDPPVICEGNSRNAVQLQTSLSVPVTVLASTGAAAPPNLLGTGLTSTVTWTVTNRSTGAQMFTFSRNPDGNTGTGWTSTGCTTSGGTTSWGFITLDRNASYTVTCPYTFSADGTYTFNATVTPLWGTARKLQIPIQVGTVSAAWDHGTVVIGHPATLTLTNGSLATIGGFTIRNAYANGLPIDSASATGGLSYDSASSDETTAVFAGSLAPGASSTVTIRYTRGSIPAPTSTTFTLTMTPAEGARWAISRTLSAVPLVLPLPQVANLSILSNAAGRRLEWTRVSGNGATATGVVVFRTNAGTPPAVPLDFHRYTESDSGVVHADTSSGVADESLPEPGQGNYNYRVCSHDASFVYSECETGYWNQAGWLDSAVPPTGGWTRQLGLRALDLIGMFPGGHGAVPSNQSPTSDTGSSITVVALADGTRVANPIALTTLPAVNTVGSRLPDGRYVAFAAEQNGVLTAIDVLTGEPAWAPRTYSGESFTAGVSGVAQASAARAFQDAYGSDVLFLGSATTGNVLAVDAATGDVLWKVATGSKVRALPIYDSASNLLVVPSDAGVLAYDLGTSSPGVAPKALSYWNVPGEYTAACTRTTNASYVACIDRTGELRVIEKATGTVHAHLPTGLERPTTVVRMLGGTPGFMVANNATVVRVTADASFTTLAAPYQWGPGATLSPPIGFSSSGYLIVAADDQRLHKLDSETLAEISFSDAVPSRNPATALSAPSYDSTDRLYLFGTGEGRIWAVPAF